MAGARNFAVLPASPNGPHQRHVWELSRELWRVWDDDAAVLESEVEAAGAAGCEADSMPDSIDWSGVDGAAQDGFRGWPYRSSARGVRPMAVPVLCVCNNSQVCLAIAHIAQAMEGLVLSEAPRCVSRRQPGCSSRPCRRSCGGGDACSSAACCKSTRGRCRCRSTVAGMKPANSMAAPSANRT